MTVTTRALCEAHYLSVATVAEYTATATTRIDAAVLVNTGAADARVTMYIAQSVDAAATVMHEVRIRPGESYLCSEITGQAIEDGYSLFAKSTHADAVVFRATGVVIT